MDTKAIKRQFAAAYSTHGPGVAELTRALADWVASQSANLKPNDIQLLVTVGSALHFVHLEQEWQRNGE